MDDLLWTTTIIGDVLEYAWLSNDQTKFVHSTRSWLILRFAFLLCFLFGQNL